MGMIAGLLALIVLGFGLYVRFAPSDAARWHQPLPTDAVALEDCVMSIQQGRGDARAACLVPGETTDVLMALDTIAVTSPRTKRLAGSWADGRITWITRSALWGFPDYTTAQVTAGPDGKTRLDIHARLRFGESDLGVNAARLVDWLTRLKADLPASQNP